MRISKPAIAVLAGAVCSWALAVGGSSDEAVQAHNQLPPEKSRRHVVIVVWDGMRPDFVNEPNCPTLCQLARGGVTFAHHHSVYPSATEVNGTAIFTGGYPAHDGILGNHEYRPDIDPSKPVRTESAETVRKGDELTHGRYLHLPTLAEIVRGAGGKAAVAGAKPVALLADRAARSTAAAGANVFAGAALPTTLEETLAHRYGPFPKEGKGNPTRNDWTAEALIDPLWAEGVPDFTLLWLNQPDASQHQTGPGSKASLEGIRNADQNLARVLKALEAKGARETTDVLVISDHGFSTIASRIDMAKELQNAGLNATREFKAKPARGDVLVVGNSGTTTIYVIGHDADVIQKTVGALQRSKFSGAIFTREALPGTFALSQAHLDSDLAADVIVASRWTAEKNQNGTPGMIMVDASSSVTEGSHVSLSPFDMHATLVAAGPDFRSGVVDALPSGNVDIAPTVLWVLGIKPPKPMDGRVLAEALTINGPALKSYEPRHIEAACEHDGMVWRQYLNVTEVNGVDYLDEGNGGSVEALKR